MTDGVLPARAIRAMVIRALNDQLRTQGVGGKTVMTQGVAALGRDRIVQILSSVRAFSSFELGNDPYDEHDFGRIDVDGEKFFWKIDYYDRHLEFGSPDPSDPNVTERVMTVMRCDEY